MPNPQEHSSMSFKIITTFGFEKSAKALSKQHRSLKSELEDLSLEVGEGIGEQRGNRRENIADVAAVEYHLDISIQMLIFQ